MDVILLGEIQDLIGATNATGGSTTAGTVMAKLNAIIGNTATNNTASETGTLSQKLSSIISYTKTNNTASTTGTLSQKISSAISNTAATTTENASGTLSAKLTYLINRRNKIVTPSSTNLKTLSSSGSVTINGCMGAEKETSISENGTVYTCYIKYPGTYRAYFTSSLAWTNYDITKDPSYTVGKESGASGSTQTATVKGNVYILSHNSLSSANSSVTICSASQKSVGATTKTLDFSAQPGDRIQMRISISQTSNRYLSCNSYVYIFDTFVANWTDISIRGTVNEVDGAVV